MNSKTGQLTENGTEIVRLFARFALGASFLSAVADRFGLWGPHGAKNVSWGDFAHFVEYTGAVMSLFPSSLTVSFAWAATVAETLFGILLIAGFKIRITSVLSGLLLLSFAIGMVTGLGIKTPFDYSVFSAAAAAFLLAFWEPDRFTLDKLLNRLRNRAGGPNENVQPSTYVRHSMRNPRLVRLVMPVLLYRTESKGGPGVAWFHLVDLTCQRFAAKFHAVGFRRD
jgi:uncharacterized membrane protein YphA (DoxX/SURF4 family)